MRKAAYAALIVLFIFCGLSPMEAAGYQTVTIKATYLGGMTTHFNVILPTGYNQSSRRYPVLYLLHGYMGDYTNWVKLTHLVDYAKPYQEIIVMPGGENGWYVNDYAQPQMRWEDYYIKELIPYIDAHYRTIASRRGRAIAGLSMGGYGAMMLGLKYHRMFIAIASLSGVLASAEPRFEETFPNQGIRKTIAADFGPLDNSKRPMEDPFWLIQKLTPATCPHLFLAIGSSDPFLAQNRRFVRLLSKLGFRYRYHEVPGGHDWKVWNEEIRNALRLEAPILGASAKPKS